MAAECFGEDGEPVRGQVGELVITQPWPGMTAGFWRDPERYEETYWSRWPDVWVHGDWAYVDDDGFWFIQGRSDDTLKIAGKRLGPAEVESVLVGHPAVAEAGVIGVPHEVKGESVVCFVVLAPGPRAVRAAARRAVRSRRPADGQGAQARAGPVHARSAEDPQRQDHAPRDPRDLPRQAGGRRVVAGEPGRGQGDRRGDVNMVRVSVFLDEATRQAIGAEARTAGVSRSRVIARAVAEYVESRRRAREGEEARRRFAEAVALADAVADRLGDWDPVAIIREFRDTRKASQRRPPPAPG